MRAFWIVLLWGVVSICPAVGAEERLEDHWSKTLLTIGWARSTVETSRCYKDARAFTGCGFALNAMLALHSPALRAMPRRTTDADGSFAIVGDFVLVLAPQFSTTSRAAFLRAYRRDRKALNEMWSAEYRASQETHVDFAPIFDWIAEKGYFGKHPNEIAAAAVNAATSVWTDPHTGYLPLSYMQREYSGENNRFVGIGAVIQELTVGERKATVVQSVLEGGPAAVAGLLEGDEITHIDGVASEGSAKMLKQILGAEGSKVTLRISRSGNGREIEVIRGVIRRQNVTSRIEAHGNQRIAYVRIENFIETNTASDVAAAIHKLLAEKPDLFIVDLRKNRGGLVDEAVKIANFFLPKGKLVTYFQSLGPNPTTMEYWTSEEPLTDLPLATLIDEYSASASELFAGAMQDHRRSLIVGVRSFGKGSMQQVRPRPLMNLVYKETQARFFRPFSGTNQIVGVHPDLTVYLSPVPNDDEKEAYREEDEYLALPALGASWSQPAPRLMSKLQDCIESQGTAKADWQDGARVPRFRDYQLRYALDASQCWEAENYSLSDPTLKVAIRSNSSLDRDTAVITSD